MRQLEEAYNTEQDESPKLIVLENEEDIDIIEWIVQNKRTVFIMLMIVAAFGWFASTVLRQVSTVIVTIFKL